MSTSSSLDGSAMEEDDWMFQARERNDADLTLLVDWIPDSQSLYLFSGPRLRWPLTVEQLAEMNELAGFSAWIVTGDEHAPVGHFDLIISGTVARLGRVLIDPAKRGHGLAHVLVQLAVGKAHTLGAKELLLNVVASNEPAIRTYERAGFTALPGADRPDIRAMTLLL